MLNVKILQIIFKLWHIYMCNSENIACVLSASANRFAWGSRTIIHTHCCQCVCAAVYRIGARPLNQIIAREHLFLSLSLTQHTPQQKKSTISRPAAAANAYIGIFRCAAGPPSTKSCTCGQHHAVDTIYLFICLFCSARAACTYVYI